MPMPIYVVTNGTGGGRFVCIGHVRVRGGLPYGRINSPCRVRSYMCYYVYSTIYAHDDASHIAIALFAICIRRVRVPRSRTVRQGGYNVPLLLVLGVRQAGGEWTSRRTKPAAPLYRAV
jgi:hypothetical protein